MDADALARWDIVIDGSKARDCCKSHLGPPIEEGNMAVRICTECGRKHRYMLADISELLTGKNADD